MRHYHLSRNKGMRVISTKYFYIDLVFCALIVENELRSNEPSSYEEAINFDKRTEWKWAMEEWMESLRCEWNLDICS